MNESVSILEIDGDQLKAGTNICGEILEILGLLSGNW